MTPTALIMIISAYMLGSISSAVLICRLFRIPDPRTTGSHNPGATNVLRSGSKVAALSVLLIDMLKGTIPVWLSWYLGVEDVILGMVAIAACLGHMYPLFFHFRGGKGVATALGSMAPMGLGLMGMLMATWVTAVFFTRYSSVASILTALIAPLYTWWFRPEYTFPVSMLCCLIILRHHRNIKRLYDGTEPKVGDRTSSSKA
ncbi:glycerol-3-phosphate 1-O-acyltransferase PlsY [Vibrio sp. S9_S30]|uniref:glycerol-3-phosphate 1-O-acyltransferase PlsY n=1 Tax=Vibrio sp. S9_S30 TaxID=2720226 RepID=UPI00168156A0|nr:glycerol-3-phosphate 1-O-acyltransferase PlsY [Vibrio sp. S9_S30]MBD1555545.1 glycerol-3-phosphate 1-O-acyltransferase PlsY [Vibrio sp. S9_S30]